jgi:hypothetical protein
VETLQALSLFYPRMLTSPKSAMEGKGRQAEACILRTIILSKQLWIPFFQTELTLIGIGPKQGSTPQVARYISSKHANISLTKK